jgi:hypothetical protein
MSKPHLDFAAIRSIAARIDPAETDLHDAIASNADLISSVIRAGAPMNISPMLTHGVVAALASATTDLVSGMDKTLAVHRHLADLREQVGLRTFDFGGGKYKGDDALVPQTGAIETAPHLKLAATA